MDDAGIIYATMIALTQQNITHDRGGDALIGEFDGLVFTGDVADTTPVYGVYSAGGDN